MRYNGGLLYGTVSERVSQSDEDLTLFTIFLLICLSLSPNLIILLRRRMYRFYHYFTNFRRMVRLFSSHAPDIMSVNHTHVGIRVIHLHIHNSIQYSQKSNVFNILQKFIVYHTSTSNYFFSFPLLPLHLYFLLRNTDRLLVFF